MYMKIKPIYDAKYYKVEGIISNPDFVSDVRKLLKTFCDYGCPVPEKGFRNHSEFDEWQKRLWTKYDNGVRRTGKDEEFPIVVYGITINEILNKYGLDPKNKDDKYWIDQYIFFKARHYEKPLAVIKFIPSLQGKDPELWIRYFGHTKPLDIRAERIVEYQKLLPDYRGKNKPKDMKVIHRNKIVIELYREQKGQDRKNPFGRERRLRGRSIAQFVVNKLKKKYPELNVDLVNQIVKGMN